MDSLANGISTGLPCPSSERSHECNDNLDHDESFKPKNKAQNVSQSCPIYLNPKLQNGNKSYENGHDVPKKDH